MEVTGNFPTVTRMLLAKIPDTDGKMTYVYDDYVFHYVVEDGICYLCMSDEQNKHRLPYAFLLNMKDLFLSKYGIDAAQKAIAFSFNEEFSTVICDRMDYFNSGGSADNIDALKNQIDEVKEGMVQNIEKVLERGEKIELLVDKTDRLNQQAFRFESTGRSLARHMYWRRIRNMTILAVIGVIAVFIITASACGGLDFHRCSKH
jgi:vesicle-associated membrane protein 7